MKKLNLPNKLTVLRMVLIPVYLVFTVCPILTDTASRIVGAVLFCLISLTDMLDGKIARKYNLITDFGKFLDPLADKLLVISAMLSILIVNRGDSLFCMIFVWAVFIVFLRELSVTSLRMIASSRENVVIAANFAGKLKTVSQMVGIVIILLEPVIIPQGLFGGVPILSYIFTAVICITTIWSGIGYFKAYMPLLDPEK